MIEAHETQTSVQKDAERPGFAVPFWMNMESRLARLAVRRPYAVAAVLALFVLLCVGTIAWRIHIDSDVLNLLPQRFDSVQTLKIYDREFSQARELTFGLLDEKHEADMDAFLDRFAAELRKEPWVVRVLDRSPMDSPEGEREMQTLAIPLLFDLEPKAFADAIQQLKPEAIAQRFAHKRAEIEAGSPKAEMELTYDPLGLIASATKPLNGSFSLNSSRPLASADGSLRVVVVATNQAGLDEKTCQAVMKQVEAFKKRVLAGWTGAPKILVTGRTAFVSEISQDLSGDVTSTLLGSIILVTGVFFIGFRRFRPLLAILLVLLLCCLAAVAAGTVIFSKLNVVTMGLCSILIGLGVDFGMLLYGSYQTHRNMGHDHEEAAAYAVHQLGRGIVFGAITTAAAFISLLLSESPGFAQLGVLIAIGIVFAALFMMTVFFVLVGRSHKPSRHDLLFAVTERYVNRLFVAPRPVLVTTLALLVLLNLFAFLPIGKVQFQADPKSLEPANSPAGNALRTIVDGMRKPGEQGIEPVLAIVRSSLADGENVPHREVCDDFSSAWKEVRDSWSSAVGRNEIKSYSCPAAFALSNTGVVGNLEILHGRGKIVDFTASRRALREALDRNGFDPSAFSSAFGMLDLLEKAHSLADAPLNWNKALPKESMWRFVLDRFLASPPEPGKTSLVGAAYITPNKTIDSPAEQKQLRQALNVPGVKVHLSGWRYVMADLVPWSHSKLFQLSVAMVVFNILILIFIYRAAAPLMTLMLALGLSIGAMIAGLKLTGLPLNLFNILAFPLVLGVGVDYGIYIVVGVRQAALESDPAGRARILASIVKPVLLSGLTAIAGFASLGLASNPALSSLGLVCALGVACCLFSTLFLILPASLSSFRK